MKYLPQALLPLALAGAVFAATSPALALQEEPVKGSGTIGGALLATEVVLVTEALAGVDRAWVYWFSAIASAGIGGYVGSRVEQRTESEVSTTMMGAGIVLAVPTLVWVGNLRDADTKAPNARTLPPTWLSAERSVLGGDGVAPRIRVIVPLVSGAF